MVQRLFIITALVALCGCGLTLTGFDGAWWRRAIAMFGLALAILPGPAFVVLALVIRGREAREHERKLQGRCVGCGYDLRASAGPRMRQEDPAGAGLTPTVCADSAAPFTCRTLKR